MTHRIALIGFGTIAADVAAGLREQPDEYVVAALVRRPDALLPDDVYRLDDLAELLSWRPDLVVEAAGQAAVRDYAESFLKAGVPVVITSVGALADDAQRQALHDAAQLGKAQLIIPAGAIGSLDYLGALRHIEGARVRYESRKPVAAWAAELAEQGYDAAMPGEPVVLYEGDAATAAQKYPKNLNVAATLAFAGVGMLATEVKVVADPGVTTNQHTIHVDSPLGTMTTKIVNQPSPRNPKTSWVVAQSVLAVVHRQFAKIVVG